MAEKALQKKGKLKSLQINTSSFRRPFNSQIYLCINCTSKKKPSNENKLLVASKSPINLIIYINNPIHKLRKKNASFFFLRFTVSEAHACLSVKRNYTAGVAFSKSAVCSEVLDFLAARCE